MRLFAFALAVTMALAGCAVAAPQSNPPTAPHLEGTQWRFVTLRGKSIPDAVHATLRFDDQGRVSGRGGCNSYGGSFASGNDGALHFGQMMSTRMACLQPAGAMETEQGVLRALNDTVHVRVQGGGMTLLDVSGTALATLRAGD